MSNADEDRRGGRSHGSDMANSKAKFADFVRIHAIEGKIITRDDEKKILEDGLTRFGLDFQEAHGALLSIASERDIALISSVERHIEAILDQKVKRGKITKQDFDDTVASLPIFEVGCIPIKPTSISAVKELGFLHPIWQAHISTELKVPLDPSGTRSLRADVQSIGQNQRPSPLPHSKHADFLQS